MLSEGAPSQRTAAVATGNHDFIFPAIVEHMRDGVLAIDGNGNIITINAPARQILKLGGDVRVSQNFAESIISRRDLTEVNDAIIDAIYAPNNVLTRDVTVPDGDYARNLVIRTSMLRDNSRNEPLGVVAIISDVSEKVRALRERIEFGHLILLFISMLGLADIVTLIVHEYLKVNVHSPAFTWTYILMIAAPVFITVHNIGMPLKSIGLTFENWQRSAIEGVVVSAVIFWLFYGIAALRGPLPPAPPTSEFASLTGVGMGILLYVPHSFLQEVLTRGVLQNSLVRLINDRRGIRALMITSLIFGLFHSYIGLPAVAVTTLAGIVIGALAMRHGGNLIGATILHVVGGTMAYAFGFM